MEKRLIQCTNYLAILVVFSLFYSCIDETETLPVNDHLIYFDSRVVFSERIYIENGNTAILETTVTVPNELVVADYGHCWITQDANPTISDIRTSFGSTNLKSFIIRSIVSDYSSFIKYYYRAYIIADNEIIYDFTYVFPVN